MADAILRIKTVMDTGNAVSSINTIQRTLSKLKLPSNLGNKLGSDLTDINDKFNQFQALANKGIKTKGDFSKLNSSAKEVESSIRVLKKDLNSISEKNIRLQVANLPEVKELEREIERLKKTYTELGNLGTNKIQGVFGEKGTNEIKKLVGESKNLKPALENAFKAIQSGNIDEGVKSLNELETAVKKINGGALNQFEKNSPGRKAGILQYIQNAKTELSEMASGATTAEAKLEQLKADRFKEISSGIASAKAQLDNFGNSATKTTREVLETARATQNMESQLSGLQTQANYFFSLQNMLQLFRRGLTDTIQTVKDLDKAMTETAVVTDFSVSDMWNMLPEYTKLANKLGATTQGAYETMTLYFQQGLNKEQTFEIGEETMKMARIAGLDYAQTTNMMTAALRGFNMELNQTSAKKVNDVYSELAAITASDTRELGLAMERTASIAHSANMDFGNTTAFLAQMIETTREAPENLGTAMKTIIARFQELKENPYEISEVEGEEVDFNRVDKALKTIGVDLMDNRDKFRDLDDVFMDISQKWDGLSQTQQRYIATMAAGSRQQSRFLAMVQNYDRLKELTDAAANSEGASEVQFAKTLDSMEAKLHKLNNAWDQFTMGITNNELIKSGTGLLVKMLDAVNKFETGIEHLGDKIGGIFGDIFKSLTSFAGLLLAFKGAGRLTDIGIGMLGGMLGMGKGVKTSMFGGMSGMKQATNMAQAKAISSPIVTAINKLTAVMTRGKVSGVTQEAYGKGVGRQELKSRRQQLKDMTMSTTGTGHNQTKTAKSFTIGSFSNVFKDLNREEQAALYRGQKGTRAAIQRSFTEGIKGLKVSDEAQIAAKRFYTDLDYAMASGSQEVTDGLTKSFDPVKVGKMIGGDVGQEISNAAREKRKQIIRQGAALNLRGKDLENYWRTQEQNIYGAGIKANEKELKQNTSRLNSITSAANSAGAAFMQLGVTIQNLGFERVGGTITTIGSALMSVGMMAETTSHAMKVLKIETAGLAAALPGVGIGLALAAVAFGAAFASYKIEQNRIKDIRKSGQEIVSAYEDTTKSVQENLNKLDKYKADWGKWSGGVDINGNNINLGSEEYQDYKKAVKEITQMQPELIKGYNAEGEAIIDNNTALSEAIRLEKKREKTATEDYLKNGQKIINRRNTTERWQKSQRQKVGASDYSQGAGSSYYEKSTIEKDAQKVANAIKKIDGGEELLKKWNITFDSMGNITQNSIATFRDYGGEIQNALVKSFEGTEITDAQQKLLDNSQNAIAQLGEDFKGVEKVSKETFDALKVHATDQGFYDNIDSELIAPFQKAIGRIAEEDLSWNEAQDRVNDLGKKYQQLGGHMQDYHDIQDKVAEAQKEFGADLNTDAYRETVEDLTEPMDEWIEELENSTDQADQILAEWISQQKNRFLDLSESLPTLEEGFNTLTSEIASANSAYDNWAKRNEESGDYYTASEGFKKMYDEVNDGVDDLGKKSQSWWSAAESMMGEDFVMKNSSKAVEQHMKDMGRYFEEGKKGVDNFVTDLATKYQDSKYKLEDGSLFSKYINYDGEKLNFNIDDISDEQFEQLAASIGLSTDAFTALLNKARQFYDIDFSNVEDMRAAIAAGETSMIGKKTTNGQQNLYMRESEFRAQIRASGETDENKIKEAEKKLTDAGVVLTKNVKELEKADLANYFKDWGLTQENGKVSTHDFIAALDKMQYNKDEISELYKNNQGLISDADTANYEDTYSAYRASEDPTTNSVFSIQGTTEGILSAVNSIALSMGILTKDASQEIDAGVKKAESFDSNVIDYDNYKDYQTERDSIESSLTATLDQLEAARDKATNDKDRDAIDKKIDQVSSALEAIKDVTLSRTEFDEAKEQAATSAVTDVGGKTEQYYKDTAIDKDTNKLDADKLNSLIGSVQKNVEGKNEQNNVIGQYLQNSTKTLSDNGASNKEIASSIQTAAQKMSDNNMKPAEIAAAINQGYGTNLKKEDITTDKNGKIAVDLDESKLQEQLSSIHATIDATVTIAGFSTKSKGQNNPNSAFYRTGTMARGSRKGYVIPGRPTLMGEEGEEVVWEPKRNEAYVVGSNGPQFGNISKNAVVWNAQQTKKIKKNSKTVGGLGTGARGITPIGTMKGGNAGSSAGGGGKKIPGMLSIDAIATVKEVIPPTPMAEIPVKAKLEVEGSESGGIVNKIKGLFGKGESGPTIKVAAEATSVKIKEQAEAIKLTGDIVKLNNKADNVKGIEATATVTKVIKSGSVAGEPVKVQATASTSTPKVVQPKVNAGSQTMNVTANTAQAQSKINALVNIFKKTYTLKYKASGPSSIKVPISANFTGSWQKTVKINKAEKGLNNYIAHRAAPSFGSAASGHNGRLGPKGRGGLTLTGEKGYEIAWLPSENRSMILGTKGPQMLALPNNAVVWNHEQSKEILKKQQTIPAGSMGNSIGGSIPVNTSRSSSTTKATSSTAKTVTNAAKHVAKKATETAKSIGYVSVWWENIARKTEITQRRMDSALKSFEKFTKEMSATLHKTGESLASGGGGGDDYLKSIEAYMGYNQAQVNKANEELNELITSTDRQIQAWKTKTGKDDKKANKAAYNAGRANVTKISYKKGKKTKDEYVNLSPYIKEENGTYVIDQNKINAIGNVDKRKAVVEAANKEINDRLSKKYTAEDNIQKAQEAIEKMAEDLYKTFFAWENELTKIWNLTKKIEATEGNISRNKEYQETLNKQLSTGLVSSKDSNYIKTVMNTFKQGITESTDKIKDQVELIEQQKDALQKTLSITDEQTTLASVQKKLNERYALDTKVDEAKATLDTENAGLSSAQQRKTNAQNQINALKKKKKKAKTKSAKNKIQKQIDAAWGELNKAQSDIDYYQNRVNKATEAYNNAVTAATQNLSNTEKLAYEEYAKELQETIDAQRAAQKYLNITQNADGTVEIEFKTEDFEKDKLEGMFTEERGKAIQDYVKKISETNNDLSNAYKDANTSINELYDQLSQLQDEWADYANELWDISEAETKKEVDIAKNLSSAITDALKRLLDEIKRKLDERRKQEDNTKTERDISQKQQRLAALRADTAGGHQVEIAQLEKEIADAQQDYQRSLEDQLLDRLQQQADLAAEQRERQIELQESIAEGVNNAALVNLWMSDPTNFRDEIYEAYKTANEYNKKPEALQDQLDTKFEELMTGLETNQDKQKEVTEAIGSIQNIIKKIAESLKRMTLNITNIRSDDEKYTVEQAKDLLGVSYEDLRKEGGYTLQEFADAGVKYEDAKTAFSRDELKTNSYYAEEAKKEEEEEEKEKARVKLKKAWESYYYSNQNTVNAFNAAKKEAENLGINTSEYDVNAVNAKIKQQKDTEARQRQIEIDKANKDRQDKENNYMNYLVSTKRLGKNKIKSSHINELFRLGGLTGRGKATVLKELVNGTGGLDPYSWNNIFSAIIGADGIDRYNLVKTFGSNGSLPDAVKQLKSDPNTISEIKKHKKYASTAALSFKTGGLADYTGPAWLDGTPSKPELVLNAADTKNFLALRDVLDKAVSSSNSVDNSSSNTSYEININVDHINNDYDVDKIAARIKKDIVKDAGYRNTTQVRNFR